VPGRIPRMLRQLDKLSTPGDKLTQKKEKGPDSSMKHFLKIPQSFFENSRFIWQYTGII